jgi:hypothetical protein
MWYSAVLLLLFSAHAVVISSLQCYSCRQLIIVNYPVTSDTVPSFSDCELVSATQCSITVTWDKNINITTIAVETQSVSSMQNVSDDSVVAMALLEAGPYGGTPFSAHNLFFTCMTSDKCNDDMSLKRILRSVMIEDSFRQELLPLIHVVDTFDPKSAACFAFNNATDNCPSVDLDDCERCQISINKALPSSQEVCATCHRNSVNVNAVIHSKTFLLNNRTQFSDHVQLDCQLKGCNSIANINQIYKASNIKFDFGRFFEN